MVAMDRARSGCTLWGWGPEAQRRGGEEGAAVKGHPAAMICFPRASHTPTLDSESSQGLLPAQSSGPRLTGKQA